jgi:hypothetical protein
MDSKMGQDHFLRFPYESTMVIVAERQPASSFGFVNWRTILMIQI